MVGDMMSMVMSSTDVCAAEDALNVLLEYLVDPRLPQKSFARSKPTAFNQELIAKQIHAAVMLHNYYYKKQQPQIEFLGFESFCKVAVILRPILLEYMKLMLLSNDTMLDDLEKELSLTEKVIMNACDISLSLDASKSAPSTEGWPITKVAVFLIDSKKEKCLLKFGSITEGVWSVIERDADLSNKSSSCTAIPEQANKKKRFIRKPLKNASGADDICLQQIAFSAVKDATGINESDLVIVEKHDVYSLSKEKTTVRFYIMQCIQENNNQITQPIEGVVKSLQGPLFERSSGQWMHTSVVEYFHLLPYAALVSDWFSGKPISERVQRAASEIANVFTSGTTERSSVPEAQESSNKDFPRSNKSAGSVTQNEDEECCAVDLPDDGPCIMESDDSFVVNNQTKDKGSNVASKVKSAYGQNGSVDKMQKVGRDKPVASGNKNCKQMSLDQDGMLRNGHGMLKHHSNSRDLIKVQTVIASKDQELSQAALKVILSKRAKLCLQMREIEDQIAQCDKDIQIIMNGGEGDLAIKIESVIEGCNDISVRSLIQNSQHGKDQSSSPSSKSGRLPANIRRKENPCQELDELCCQKNWILPTYCVSAIDGGFQADVIVKGTEYEYSTAGKLQTHPHEARESAATQMLHDLRNRKHGIAY